MGTPLHNNLPELWSLLDFILPYIFSSHEEFESRFDLLGKSSDEATKEEIEENRKAQVVAKLHAILRPFILRRMKSDVEQTLPRKKEKLTSVVEMGRPRGTKTEKKRKFNEQANAPVVKSSNAIHEERKSTSERKLVLFEKAFGIQAERTRIEAEKNRLEQLKEEERIMTMDTTNMTPMRQEYYHQRQLEILESRRNKNSGGV